MRGETTTRARELRRNETDAERLLWRYLRDRRLRECKFRRQHPIGPFFADFASPRVRVIIELDGGQHAARVQYDTSRTRYLEQSGWRVLRFWDNEVLNETQAVLERIFEVIAMAPHPNPLPAGGERE